VLIDGQAVFCFWTINRNTYKILKKHTTMIKISNGYYWFSLTFVACNSDDSGEQVSNSSDGLPLTAGTFFFKIYCIRVID
jgi:hypothetical protein